MAALSALVGWGIRARTAALATPSFVASRDQSAEMSATGSSATWWYLGTGVGLGIVVLVVVLVVVLIRRERRRRKDPEFEYVNEWRPSRWLALGLLTVLAAITAATVLIVIAISRASVHSPATSIARPAGVPTQAPASVPSVTSAFPPWAVILLVIAGLIVLGGVAVGAWLLIRRRAGNGPVAFEHVALAPAAPQLLQSPPSAPVESTDPRARVLARYHDFESKIQEAGIPVLPSDTSGEIADRTTRREPGITESVSGLTELFRRARYSAARIDVTDAQAAERYVRAAAGADAVVGADAVAGADTRADTGQAPPAREASTADGERS